MRFNSTDTATFVNPLIRAAVQAEPGILLQKLLAKIHGLVEPDEVYLLIATGGIYVDLSAAAIAEPDKVHIFANAEMATAYQLARNEFKPVKPICEQVNSPQALPEAHGEAFRLLVAASRKIWPLRINASIL